MELSDHKNGTKDLTDAKAFVKRGRQFADKNDYYKAIANSTIALRLDATMVERDGIYELRICVGRANYRMLYFFHENKAAVISHGLTKEKRVPPKDIDRAIAAKQRFVESPRRHTHQEN